MTNGRSFVLKIIVKQRNLTLGYFHIYYLLCGIMFVLFRSFLFIFFFLSYNYQCCILFIYFCKFTILIMIESSQYELTNSEVYFVSNRTNFLKRFNFIDIKFLYENLVLFSFIYVNIYFIRRFKFLE